LAWPDYVNAAGIVGAFAFSAYQIRRLVVDARQRDADRRTERALELYRDLVVDGDTADAFNNLSVYLRNKGTQRFGVNTWYIMADDDLADGGVLDPAKPGNDALFQCFYRVLWYFERVESALHFSLIDPEVLFRTIGFHCWWWGQILRNIHAPKASDALHDLAPKAADWARDNNDFDRWVARCMTDFAGAGPTDGSVPVSPAAGTPAVTPGPNTPGVNIPAPDGRPG
jgi:hypothetical protein